MNKAELVAALSACAVPQAWAFTYFKSGRSIVSPRSLGGLVLCSLLRTRAFVLLTMVSRLNNPVNINLSRTLSPLFAAVT